MSADMVCPHGGYQRGKAISCAVLSEDMKSINIRFNTDKQRYEYTRKYCNNHAGYTKCPYYKCINDEWGCGKWI